MTIKHVMRRANTILTTFDDWAWFITLLFLMAHLLAVDYAIYGAVAMTLVNGGYFYIQTGRLTSFPLQVRLVYVVLLLIDIALPWHLIHVAQLVGTLALLVLDYCFLARTLALMPWNRQQNFSWSLLIKAYFSKPVIGRISF